MELVMRPPAWHDERGRTLTEIDFTTSARFPGLHFHERLEVAMETRVDGLLCSGPAVNLEWARAELSKKYEVKGDEMVDRNSEIKFLCQIIGRNEHGFCWEKDPQHWNISPMEFPTAE